MQQSPQRPYETKNRSWGPPQAIPHGDTNRRKLRAIPTGEVAKGSACFGLLDLF